MVCYHNEKTARSAREMTVAEVRAVAGWIGELGLDAGETDDGVLRPVGRELLLRYGHEVGPRISAEFLEAFERLDGAVVPEPPGGGGRPGVAPPVSRDGRASRAPPPLPSPAPSPGPRPSSPARRGPA